MQHLKEYDEFINEGLSVLNILNWTNNDKELRLYIKSGHFNDVFIEHIVDKNFHKEPKSVRDKLISAMSRPDFVDFFKKYMDFNSPDRIRNIIGRNMVKQYFGIEKNRLK